MWTSAVALPVESLSISNWTSRPTRKAVKFLMAVEKSLLAGSTVSFNLWVVVNTICCDCVFSIQRDPWLKTLLFSNKPPALSWSVWAVMSTYLTSNLVPRALSSSSRLSIGRWPWERGWPNILKRDVIGCSCWRTNGAWYMVQSVCVTISR